MLVTVKLKGLGEISGVNSILWFSLSSLGARGLKAKHKLNVWIVMANRTCWYV